MTRATKTLLSLSIVGLVSGLVFATGIVDASQAVVLYTILPLGAVFFGLFLISKMLEKETEAFNRSQSNLQPAEVKVQRAADTHAASSSSTHH